MELFLYNTVLLLYSLAIRFVSPFHKKARLITKGRKESLERIKKFQRFQNRLVWFHAASLGEFEQGRPVIEALKEKEPDTVIVLTFFSPSGYEIRKNYKGADHVFYLPQDTKRNAELFVKKIAPDAAVFIKYEFWYHYLYELHKNEIDTFSISATFNKNQPFFKSWGKIYKRMLKFFTVIFVQDNESVSLLNSIGINKNKYAGDTRFDRVKQIAENAQKLEKIEKFRTDGRPIIVCGSTWPADESILLRYINQNSYDYKWIIVPHEIDESHIRNIIRNCQKSIVRYSDEKADFASAEVLIIDCIGILSSVYGYGKIAYIGGGFGTGIHNTLEAAIYGIPVIFGPKYEKFREAVELIENQGAFSISNEQDFREIIDELNATDERTEEYGIRAYAYTNTQFGATEIIMKRLCKSPEDSGED